MNLVRLAAACILPLALGVSACGSAPTADTALSSATQSSAEKKLTPITAKKALQNLGAFDECGEVITGNELLNGVICNLPGTAQLDLQAPGTASYSTNDFVETETGSVIVYLPRSGGISGVCGFLSGTGGLATDASVVSDGETFLAYGQGYALDALDRPVPMAGPFPYGVWPEDVQRALGGSVSSLADACGG